MTQSLVLARAWKGAPFAAIQALVPALQTQLDRDFLPPWLPHGATAVEVSAVDIDGIAGLDPASWPIFINRHSTDKGALGWHDDQGGRIFGRVFWGDCLRFGLDPGVTVSHEALEMVADPTINRTFSIAGRTFALEVCDPVEADGFGYDIGGVKVSDFVLPLYCGFFPTTAGDRYDFGGHLSRMAPDLTAGGYISELVNGQWTQITADKADGMLSARALMRGFRRAVRASR